jgi:hypothetical protein
VWQRRQDATSPAGLVAAGQRPLAAERHHGADFAIPPDIRHLDVVRRLPGLG